MINRTRGSASDGGRQIRQLRMVLAGGVAVSALMLGGAAYAQETTEVVTVTGYRASIESAVNIKRSATEMIDQINAEDIGKFPEANLAESMASLPGVDVDRGDTGEGRTITVRGLGADFTMVRINGMDALSTAGSVNAQTPANRSRGFDFNTFASELFRSLRVQKSAGAASEEGSLGAIVDLNTGNPLDYDGLKLTGSAQEQYFELGDSGRPRLAALVADQFFNHTLGFTASISYSSRGSKNDSYSRNVGQSDVFYRGQQFNTTTGDLFNDAYGVALPSNDTTHCSSMVNPTGLGCGSNPAAYYNLTHLADGTTNLNAIIPTFPGLSHTTLKYERMGATGSVEWRPINRLDVRADYLYATYKQTSNNYGLGPIGTNRNGFSSTLAQGAVNYTGSAPGSTNATNAWKSYSYCTQASYYCAANTSGLGQPALLSGTVASYDPYNLEAYDYYNNSQFASLYHDAGTPYGLSGLAALIGRPNTKLTGVHVIQAANPEGAQQLYVDQISLDDLDWSSVTDRNQNNTNFRQFNGNISYDASDSLRVEAMYGESSSVLTQDGMSVSFNAMDKDGFTFNEYGGQNMPLVSPGFDVSDPSNWNLVKGLSTARRFVQGVQNRFSSARLNVTYTITDDVSVQVGGDRRVFSNFRTQSNRIATDSINPTLEELAYYQYGSSAAGALAENYTSDIRKNLGQIVSFGAGLDLPAGTPTSWFAPNAEKFASVLGLNSNSVNDLGDYRLATDTRISSRVVEKDYSYFGQIDFRGELFGRRTFGNFGVRVTNTNVTSVGYIGGNATNGGFQLIAKNSYHDFLPSANLAIDIRDDVKLRLAASKVMARPMLDALSVGSSSASMSTTLPSYGNPTITLGNPYLSPIRSNNYDASLEWYLDQGALLSIAYFRKNIHNYPQQVMSTEPLSVALGGVDSTAYQMALASIDTSLSGYSRGGGQWDVRQMVNTPGGQIEGLEFSYQQSFKFLPAPFDKMGMQLNATHLSSRLLYLVNGETGSYYGASWLGNSPNAVNTTIYYDAGDYELRLTGSYRSGYNNTFPMATGSCRMGTTTYNNTACSSPVIEDFTMVKQQMLLSFSSSYDVNKHISITADGQNLLGAADKQAAYSSVRFKSRYSANGRTFRIGIRFTN